jgi:hypothetical protein
LHFWRLPTHVVQLGGSLSMQRGSLLPYGLAKYPALHIRVQLDPDAKVAVQSPEFPLATAAADALHGVGVLQSRPDQPLSQTQVQPSLEVPVFAVPLAEQLAMPLHSRIAQAVPFHPVEHAHSQPSLRSASEVEPWLEQSAAVHGSGAQKVPCSRVVPLCAYPVLHCSCCLHDVSTWLGSS